MSFFITNLKIDAIKDPKIREAFQLIKEEFDRQFFNRGLWQFFEITVTGSVTNYRYQHRLGFKPKDILQTSLTGTGALTWNYDQFDDTYLDLTTTDSCVVRLFAGAYR